MGARRREGLVWLAALFALGAMAWAAPAAAQAPILGELSGAERTRVERLIREAQKEGSVNVINPIFSDHTGKLFDEGFRKLYGLPPEFKFLNTRKGTGAVVSTVTQEIRAKKFTVDIIVVSAPAFFAPAAKAGHFLEYPSPYWKDYEEGVKRSGQVVDPPRFVAPFGYAFQPTWNRKCPGMEGIEINSYQDLLNPRLKGKTLAPDLPKSFTLTATWIAQGNVMDVVDFWRRYRDITDPIVIFRTEGLTQKVVSCERPVAAWNLSGRIYQAKLKEPTLDLGVGVYKEGLLVLGNQMAILKGAPHPSAAKLFYDFVLRPEGMRAIVAGEALYTFRANFPIPEEVRDYVTPIEKLTFFPLDWSKVDKKALTSAQEDWKKIYGGR